MFIAGVCGNYKGLRSHTAPRNVRLLDDLIGIPIGLLKGD